MGLTRTPAKEWARDAVHDERVIRPTTVRLGNF